jgi:hypothetical protein
MRKLLVVREKQFDFRLNRNQQSHLLSKKRQGLASFLEASFIRVHSQVRNPCPIGDPSGTGRDVAADFSETDLPVEPTDAIEVSSLVEVINRVAWPNVLFALEIRQEVVSVEMDLERFTVG